MAIDFSALDEAPQLEPTGKPLELRLDLIEEDPDQPRREFTEETMVEMTESIKARGIKSPVSVRPHPTKSGKWILNYGARRYRGSLAAGKETIPAFVDDTHDDFDQVIENIQRENLKPMELALFIQKRLDAGDRKNEIARNLGKDATVITQHMALVNPPPCIENVYRSGKCTSPRTLYDIRCLYEKHPEKVDLWCSNSTEITRQSVTAFTKELKEKTTVEVSEQNEDLTIREPNNIVVNDNDQGVENEVKPTITPKPRNTTDLQRISKPQLIIAYGGRSAVVLLNRHPTSSGLLYIKYVEGGEEAEVEASRCKILTLAETVK